MEWSSSKKINYNEANYGYRRKNDVVKEMKMH